MMTTHGGLLTDFATASSSRPFSSRYSVGDAVRVWRVEQSRREGVFRRLDLPRRVARGDVALLVGVSVGDEALLLGHDQGVAFSADADPIDVVPQILQPDLADHPGRLPARRHDPHRNRRAREPVVVDLDRGDVGPLGADARRFGNGQRCSVDTARGEDPSSGVEERNLLELGKVEDVVLEHARLLPLLQVDRTQLQPDGPEDAGVVTDVEADAFGDLCGQFDVAPGDGLSRAGLEAENRDEAIEDERCDRRACDEQDEARRQPCHRGGSANRHCQRLLITSGPPSPGTWNFALTARVTFGHAMKIAGGSSCRICWRSLTAVLTSPSFVVLRSRSRT